MESPSLEHWDLICLRAAAGWLELGNAREALAELDRITPGGQTNPFVLEARWDICAQDGQWETCLEVAAMQVKLAPEKPGGWLNRSFALRRAKGGGLKIALDSLTIARDKFPGEPIIPYNAMPVTNASWAMGLVQWSCWQIASVSATARRSGKWLCGILI